MPILRVQSILFIAFIFHFNYSKNDFRDKESPKGKRDWLIPGQTKVLFLFFQWRRKWLTKTIPKVRAMYRKRQSSPKSRKRKNNRKFSKYY